MPQPASAQQVSPSLANRYGSPQRTFKGMSKARKILLIGVIGVLVLAFVSWLTFGRGPGADLKLIGFNVINASETTVDFQVTKDPASTAQCEVKALNDSYTVVGWKIATVPANSTDQGIEQGRTTKQQIQLLTDSLAVSAVVDSCWIVQG